MQDPEQFSIESITERLKERFPKESDEIIYFFDWELVCKFALFLRDKNEAGGFFSKRDSEEILDRHVLESIYHVYRITKKVGSWKGIQLGDAGTGPGIPGFFFRCLKDPPVVVLIDSTKKKTFSYGRIRSFQSNFRCEISIHSNGRIKVISKLCRITWVYPLSI